jgi:hypothetical protein
MPGYSPENKKQEALPVKFTTGIWLPRWWRAEWAKRINKVTYATVGVAAFQRRG